MDDDGRRMRANQAWAIMDRFRERGFTFSVEGDTLNVSPGRLLKAQEYDEIRPHKWDIIAWLTDPVAHAIDLAGRPDDCPPVELVIYDILYLEGCAPVAVPRRADEVVEVCHAREIPERQDGP